MNSASVLAWIRKPWQSGSMLPRWLAGLLLLFGVLNLGRLPATSIDVYRPIDFNPLFVGQEAISHGEIPYFKESLLRAISRITQSEDLPRDLPFVIPVYPPWAFTMFLPLGLLGLRAASLAWYLVMPCLLVLGVCSYVHFLRGKFSMRLFLDLMLLSVAFKGTIQAMLVGQPLFLTFAMAFSALALYRRDRPVAAGVMLGLSAVKISLSFPFILFFVVRRRWKSLLSGMISGGILIAVPVILTGSPVELVRAWLAPVTEIAPFAFNLENPAYPLNYHMITMTEAGALLEYLFAGVSEYLYVIYPLIWVAVFLFWYVKLSDEPLDDQYLLVILILLTLLTSYHFFYDCIALLLFYGLSPKMSLPGRSLLLVLLIPLFIPFNGILNRVPHPESLDVLYFGFPIALIGSLLLLLYEGAARSDLSRVEAVNRD